MGVSSAAFAAAYSNEYTLSQQYFFPPTNKFMIFFLPFLHTTQNMYSAFQWSPAFLNDTSLRCPSAKITDEAAPCRP